jgi:Putative glycosyl hydrolase domain
MQIQKITLTLASVAAASVLACTGTHEAGATNTTPDPKVNPGSVQSDRGMTSSSEAAIGSSAVANTNGSAAPSVARSAADTDTTVRPKIVAGNHPTPPVLDSLIKGTLPVRGLYVFRFGANTRRLKHLIGIADSTEVNALIIDVKDEFGLNYESSDPMVKKNAGTQVKAHNLGALVDTIRAHGILPVARIVVFKD